MRGTSTIRQRRDPSTSRHLRTTPLQDLPRYGIRPTRVALVKWPGGLPMLQPRLVAMFSLAKPFAAADNICLASAR